MTKTVFAFLSPGGGAIVSFMAVGEKGILLPLSDRTQIDSDMDVFGVLAGCDVSCWPLELPSISRAKQLKILPAMLEDQLASRSGNEHFALVRNSLDGLASYLSFCVEGSVLGKALDALRAFGSDPKGIIPDFILLPVPDAEAVNIWTSPVGIVAVRRNDGSGFAAEPELLELTIPEIKSVQAELRVSQGDALASYSLLQGKFELKTQLSRYWVLFRRGAAIAMVAGIVASIGFHSQTERINDQATLLEQETHAVFTETFPDIERVIDPVLQGRRAVANLRSESGGAFLRLSERVFQAVQYHQDILLRGVRYNEQQGGYFLSVSAASFSESEAFRQALSDSGLRVTEGGSRQENGRIVSDLVIEVQQ